MNTRTARFLLLVGILATIAGSVLATASNFYQDGNVITLTWSTTSPSANAPVVKTTAKATGGIIGVALTGGGTASENVSVQTWGVFDLSVSAVTSAIAIGDYVFVADPGNVEVCTATLSNTNSGLIFGQALEAIASGSTDTIHVRLLQPSHL